MGEVTHIEKQLVKVVEMVEIMVSLVRLLLLLVDLLVEQEVINMYSSNLQKYANQ